MQLGCTSSIPIVGKINLHAEDGVAASRIARDAHTRGPLGGSARECFALALTHAIWHAALAEERAPEEIRLTSQAGRSYPTISELISPPDERAPRMARLLVAGLAARMRAALTSAGFGDIPHERRSQASRPSSLPLFTRRAAGCRRNPPAPREPTRRKPLGDVELLCALIPHRYRCTCVCTCEARWATPNGADVLRACACVAVGPVVIASERAKILFCCGCPPGEATNTTRECHLLHIKHGQLQTVRSRATAVFLE